MSDTWEFNDRGNILTPYCCYPLNIKVRCEVVQVYQTISDEGVEIENQVSIGLRHPLIVNGKEVGYTEHTFEYCPWCGKKIPSIHKR